MKLTLTQSEIARLLMEDKNADWSWEGARALAQYFDEECPEDAEFDVVETRCEFSEYPSLQSWANAYFGSWNNICDEFGPDYHGPLDGEDAEDYAERFDDAIREYIKDNGMIIEFDGGIIVSNF